jgi:hypothetical protein
MIIITIIIISCGLTERNARDHSTWSNWILSEENQCHLDDAWMNEWIKTAVADTVKTAEATTTTNISWFVNCFQRAGTKKAWSCPKTKEQTEVLLTVTVTKPINKHKVIWENAFTLWLFYFFVVRILCNSLWYLDLRRPERLLILSTVCADQVNWEQKQYMKLLPVFGA